MATKKKGISATVRARLVKLPGASRRYKDPKTGRTYSRRQFEKGRTDKKPRQNAGEIRRKQDKYITMRDIFISSQKKKGIKWRKREAMESAELKKIIKNLHSKNIKKRQAAWEAITGGNRAEWTPYIERWRKGEL